MTYETPAAVATYAKGSTGATFSGLGVKACILGHSVYLAAIVGILLGVSGYRTFTRLRKTSERTGQDGVIVHSNGLA